MEGWIDSLAGYFDGYKYLSGPVSIRLEDGIIAEIIEGKAPIPPILSGRGQIFSPAFVDGHTHLIFGGSRFNELDLKLRGYSYSDILAQGGGIQSTVSETRAASDQVLYDLVTKRLDTMLSYGSLTVEVKSGYGLSSPHEIRLLEILREVNQVHDVSVHPTFGAAHVVPSGTSREDYISEIIDDMLPKVVERNLACSIDVFCDKGAFTIDETIQILEAGTKAGLPPRVHADELEYTGIGAIAAEKFNLLSADHLLQAKTEDFEALASNDTVAMFMPLAPFGLFTDDLPMGFKETSVNVGLGSDFNPNNWALSMQTAIRMAVFRYRLTPIEALQAATSGSFKGITGDTFEPVSEGSPATFILLKASSPSEFISKFGQNLVTHVYKKGKLICKNDIKIA